MIRRSWKTPKYFNCYLKGNIVSHYQQLDKWFVAAKIVQILDLRKLFEMVETNLIILAVLMLLTMRLAMCNFSPFFLSQ